MAVVQASVERRYAIARVRQMVVSGVRFTGDGVFTSLFGEWVNKTRGFVLSLF